MSLVKKPTMTEKKIAANRRNRNLSRGPVTEEGKERIRAARLRHGVYSKSQEIALRALGEEPEKFADLLEGLRHEFPPTGRLQEELAVRLARALWLMDRTDRWHEANAVERAQHADRGRDNRLHARMMRLSMTSQSLRSLACSVARENYVTQPNELELMKSLAQDPEVHEMGEIALALFCQLQDPGARDEFGREVSSYQQQQAVLIRVKEIFGLNDPPPYAPQPASNPNQEYGGDQAGENTSAIAPPVPAAPKPNLYPHITARQWEAREPVRQLLENILTHQSELCEALRQKMLKDSIAGPSLYERAAEISPNQSEALLKRRVQESNLREVRRLTNLLLKIRRSDRRDRASEASRDESV
jgi:hypothetical protein